VIDGNATQITSGLKSLLNYIFELSKSMQQYFLSPEVQLVLQERRLLFILKYIQTPSD